MPVNVFGEPAAKRYRAFCVLKATFLMTDTDTPEIVVARLLSSKADRNFYILSDGKERFFCGGRHFPNGLSPDELVSVTVQDSRKGKLREVKEVIFQQGETCSPS